MNRNRYHSLFSKVLFASAVVMLAEIYSNDLDPQLLWYFGAWLAIWKTADYMAWANPRV